MTGSEPVTVRWNDYSLSTEQEDLRRVLRQFFERSCPPEVVRAAEPRGADDGLWAAALRAGVVGISLPESAGGQGGGLLELVLTAEEIGRSLAPVPVVDHVVAARLLAVGADHHPDLAPAVHGDLVLALAPLSGERPGPQLVPGGAVARGVLARVGADLTLLRRPRPPERAANDAGAPLAWWDPADPDVDVEVLASGGRARDCWTGALGEWRVATAAALVGLAAGACALARDYSMERTAFGVPIASFQAVSHNLVDAHMTVETARNLVLRAAWYHAHEPAARPELPAMALGHAIRTATDVTARSVHVHGGFGITLESDVSLYHRRAAVWGQPAGGARAQRLAATPALDRLVARRRAWAAARAQAAPDGPVAVPDPGPLSMESR